MNRYEEVRQRLGFEGERAGKALRRLLRGPPLKAPPSDMRKHAVWFNVGHRVVVCLATVDDLGPYVEEHVSVSARHQLVGAVELPTWEELVGVRALSWPDDVEVHQTLPALTGPLAEPYVSVTEALHLRRIRP